MRGRLADWRAIRDESGRMHWSPSFSRYPATIADVVAFASDWPGVLAAERIAREVFEATRVVWRVVPALELTDKRYYLSSPSVYETGYAAYKDAGDTITLLAPAL